ncbi:NUDIX hydrolase [Teredinibacter sp. KSP-S5-2]|uniref:NUDIX hydrolase n=1 Tax=Teredinibacter sp. KSP-S5-2 TaxID=3034506 RepID=UPI0029346316|nr:NUDIX hydrolase [Teredinibacter sp. KSP-S5-2]WNO10160.1 NUDIX hydrolase [Teredinibacter sp. KSP-S5-2]
MKEQIKAVVGNWFRVNRSTVYDNPWIRVYHDDVITPGKSKGIYGVVHFKNKAVGVIPMDDDGNTWLVKQSRYTLEKATWEIPEGGSPEGEDTLLTAKRELEEEVGLVAGKWQKLMGLHLSNSITDEYAVIYKATELSIGRQLLEDTEDIEVRKMPITEAVDMVMRGEITDAISVAGLLCIARGL